MLFTHVNSSVWPLDRRGSKVPVLYVQKFGSYELEADADIARIIRVHVNYADGVESVGSEALAQSKSRKYRRGYG